MLISLLTDIHANREALSACLAHAEGLGAERYVFLGDLVGYGADPEWVLDTVTAHCANGAVCVLGNHDEAVLAGARPGWDNVYTACGFSGHGMQQALAVGSALAARIAGGTMPAGIVPTCSRIIASTSRRWFSGLAGSHVTIASSDPPA